MSEFTVTCDFILDNKKAHIFNMKNLCSTWVSQYLTVLMETAFYSRKKTEVTWIICGKNDDKMSFKFNIL